MCGYNESSKSYVTKEAEMKLVVTRNLIHDVFSKEFYGWKKFVILHTE